MNSKKTFKSKKKPLIVYALIPILGCLFFFGIFPIFFSFYLSFYKWSLLRIPEFVGLRNYTKALHDPVFWVSLKNTFYFTGLSISIGIVIALLLALLIHHSPRFKSLFRTGYFLPVVTSMVAVSVVWKFLYQPDFGLFNSILSALGLPPQKWLISPTLAMPSIVVMSVWQGLGYNMILFMAGLLDIPEVLYEVADLDGANTWNKFKNITVPLLKPTFLFIVVISSIGSFQVFTQSYIMTRGGPEDSTRVIVQYIQHKAFDTLLMGYGSAMAFILFAIIISITMIELKFLRTRWKY